MEVLSVFLIVVAIVFYLIYQRSVMKYKMEASWFTTDLYNKDYNLVIKPKPLSGYKLLVAVFLFSIFVYVSAYIVFTEGMEASFSLKLIVGVFLTLALGIILMLLSYKERLAVYDLLKELPGVVETKGAKSYSLHPEGTSVESSLRKFNEWHDGLDLDNPNDMVELMEKNISLKERMIKGYGWLGFWVFPMSRVFRKSNKQMKRELVNFKQRHGLE